jgi:hypothetical protein
MTGQKNITTSVASATVADILERVLDKGIVIVGDIKVKIVDIELLTIQIRLVVCSVDKAIEMGMDWWKGLPVLCAPKLQENPAPQLASPHEKIEELQKRFSQMEAEMQKLKTNPNLA